MSDVRGAETRKKYREAHPNLERDKRRKLYETSEAYRKKLKERTRGYRKREKGCGITCVNPHCKAYLLNPSITGYCGFCEIEMGEQGNDTRYRNEPDQGTSND